jgi:cold shock CspA family protein
MTIPQDTAVPQTDTAKVETPLEEPVAEPPAAHEHVVIKDKLIGYVKWFNNRAGYGFITVCDGEYKGQDIFVHYRFIKITNSQYKYLVQGEYVEFTLIKSEEENFEYQATNVGGINGGPIMCETRRTLSVPLREVGVRRPYKPNANPVPEETAVREEGKRRPVSRQQRTEPDEDGFKRVERRRPTNALKKSASASAPAPASVSASAPASSGVKSSSV